MPFLSTCVINVDNLKVKMTRCCCVWCLVTSWVLKQKPENQNDNTVEKRLTDDRKQVCKSIHTVQVTRGGYCETDIETIGGRKCEDASKD